MATSATDKVIPIGVLARRSGVHIETIRYYEKIGIMPKPARTAAGYRSYEAEHLKRLAFVRRTRELGFGLDEIRDLLGLVDRGAYTCAEIRALMLDHLATIRMKIADLKRLERAMTETVSQCSGRRVPDCPIVDVLFDGGVKSDKRVPGRTNKIREIRK